MHQSIDCSYSVLKPVSMVRNENLWLNTLRWVVGHFNYDFFFFNYHTHDSPTHNYHTFECLPPFMSGVPLVGEPVHYSNSALVPPSMVKK